MSVTFLFVQKKKLLDFFNNKKSNHQPNKSLFGRLINRPGQELIFLPLVFFRRAGSLPPVMIQPWAGEGDGLVMLGTTRRLYCYC